MATKDKIVNLEDLKVVGDVVTDLKGAISATILQTGQTQAPITWEQGTIYSSNGGNRDTGTPAANAIRTNFFDKGDIYSVTPADGYTLFIAAWDNSNTYQGIWNGSSFEKAASSFSTAIVMANMPSTYLYKIVLVYTEAITPTAYTNCITAYKTYLDATDIRPDEWDAAYANSVAMQSGVLPWFDCELGSFGSPGTKYNVNTAVRTKTTVKFDNDTIIRCNDPDYCFAVREYSGADITENNFVGYLGEYYGTYVLSAGKYYTLVIYLRSASIVDDVNKYASKVEIWSAEHAENMQKYSLLQFAPMGNSKHKIIGHQGNVAIGDDFPGNTIPAFEAAGQRGAWGIETDVQVTSDGYLICIHDATLDATTTGTGAVNSKTLAEIEALSIKNYPDLKVPTFDQYIGICKTYDCVPVIEVKTTAINQSAINSIIQTLVDYGMDNKAILISASSTPIGYMQCKTAKVPFMLVVQTITDIDATIASVARYYNAHVTIEAGNTITSQMVAKLHRGGIGVGVHVVNTDADTIKSYFAMGVDVVTSDRIATY